MHVYVCACIYGFLLAYMYLHRFSRKIIWLHVATSNSNPKVIARYYLESTEKLAGIIINSFITYYYIIMVS